MCSTQIPSECGGITHKLLAYPYWSATTIEIKVLFVAIWRKAKIVMRHGLEWGQNAKTIFVGFAPIVVAKYYVEQSVFERCGCGLWQENVEIANNDMVALLIEFLLNIVIGGECGIVLIWCNIGSRNDRRTNGWGEGVGRMVGSDIGVWGLGIATCKYKCKK